SELQKRSSGRTVYMLDEPTTGLHFEDIRKLMDVLQGLVEKGNTVIIIEHNLDVIKNADWVIDMGPEGGSGGGMVVGEGTPEDLAKVEASHTGHFLAEILDTDATPELRPVTTVAALARPKARSVRRTAARAATWVASGACRTGKFTERAMKQWSCACWCRSAITSSATGSATSTFGCSTTSVNCPAPATSTRIVPVARSVYPVTATPAIAA